MWPIHVGARAELHRAVWLAGFYRWSALRGHPAPGAHPLTGVAISAWRDEDRALSRAVHVAQARFYLAKARAMRLASAVLVRLP